MTYRIGFVMDQIAGHITNYRNIRSVTETDSDILPTWHEINYLIPGGVIERLRARLPFVPTYYTGIMRGSLETHKALRRKHYDAILSNASVGVFFSPIFRRTPTLLNFDSTPRQIDRMAAYGNSDDSKTISDFKFRLSKGLYQSAARLEAWSNWARQSVIEEYGIAPDKIYVNPPGINLHFWQPAPQSERHSAKRVLFVGGDFTRKGGNLLLEWYKTQDPAQIELHVVTRETVPATPGVTVYHTMQPNTPELLALYHQSDLFVLPSLGECFGIATVEAMGAGLPVIASDVGGTADIIAEGRNGYIVPGNDVSALAQAIEAIVGDDSKRRAMGAQSRLLAEERFDMQANVRKTLASLKQIAGAPALVAATA